jgi:hypothetical protein
MIYKKIFFFLICVCFFFTACAHEPLPIAKLTTYSAPASDINNLHFTFIDARNEQLKTEKCFVQHYIWPTWIFTCGDSAFDAPLNSAFDKMFLARFPDNPEGHKTEVKIINFHFTWKPHELTGLPFIGIFAALEDVEFHGIVKMEVAVLDKEEKFIFTKIYEADVKEMKTPGDTPVYEEGFDILRKAISKVMAEFETDTKRIKFN